MTVFGIIANSHDINICNLTANICTLWGSNAERLRIELITNHKAALTVKLASFSSLP